jgi:hypothetical protein
MEDGASPNISEFSTRDMARAAIHAGKLPNRNPDRIWGGRGEGADCTICAVPVMHDEMELEIEFNQDGDTPGSITHHLHVRCFAAWEFERDNLDLVRGGSAAS